MKKKYEKIIKRGIAVACAGAIAFSLLACGTNGVSAVGKNTGKAENSDEAVLEEAARSFLSTNVHSDENAKEETVYIINGSGEGQDKTIVQVQLKNGDRKDELKDKTNLTNIENTKGDEEYIDNGDGTITWQAGGSDIFYRGDSSDKPPVSVSISYKLDGKEVEEEDLKGASGHLEIDFTYDNSAKKQVTINNKKEEIYKPCTVVSCLLLNAECANNVKVTNGKVINDGERSIVMGVAMPGLYDSLGLEDQSKEIQDEIKKLMPSGVTVEADVTDFEMSGTLTAASYDLLNDFISDDGKASEKVDELQASADELQDGADKLVDGSKELSSHMDELSEGADKLSEGAGTLKEGSDTLAEGTETLKEGMDTLADGAGQLSEGAQKLKTGTGKLSEGTELLNKNVESLPDAAAALSDALDKLNKALKSGDSSEISKYGVYEAVVAISKGAKALQTAAEGIMSGAESLSNGALGIAAGAKSGSSSPTEFGIYEAASALETGLQAKIQSLSGQLQQLSSYLGGAIGYDADALAKLQQLSGTTLTPEQQGLVGQIMTDVGTSKATVEGVKKALEDTSIDISEAITVIEGIKSGAQGIYDGALQLAAGAKSNDTSSPKKYGIYEAAAAIAEGAEQLSGSAATLASNIEVMVNEDNLGAIRAGVKTLSKKSKELVAAIEQLSGGAATVDAGTGELSGHIDEAANGAQALADGASTLTDGAAKLADGMGTFTEGVSEFSDGAGQLAEGTSELMEGITTFDKDGISKITELLKDKVGDITERLEALKDYAKEPMSFSGCLDGMDNSVQYIFKTGEI